MGNLTQYDSLFDCAICAMDRTFDLSAAERLLNEVRSYKLPKKKRNESPHLSYQRVWLLSWNGNDSLTEEMREKLRKTRWVILVCSRSVKASASAEETLRFFYSLGRKSNVLPLLIEGDPQESFPTLLFQERETHLVSEDGDVKTIREVVEPLAVDIRSDKPETALKLISHARIKIVAALIGVSYDTLEQRHFKRARRRWMVIFSLIVLVPAVLFSVFTWLWFHAEKQIAVAEQKTKIANDLFAHICSGYPEEFRKIPEAIPIVHEMLIKNLLVLKEAESLFIKDLDIGDLLVPQEVDSHSTLVSKATLLRYIGRKKEALAVYRLASATNENSALYDRSSEAFVNHLDPYAYPIGICVLSIESEASQKCGGLAEGDIIVAFNGFRFRSMEQYQIAKDSQNPDTAVTIEILRPFEDGLQPMELRLKPRDLHFIPAVM